MKKQAFLALALAALSAFSASAARIELATITANTIPGVGGLGQGNVETWLAGLVTSYNTAHNPDLPAPGNQLVGVNTGNSAPAGYPTFGNGTTSISIPTGGYNYVVLHWGGGSGGGKVQAFYIGNIGGAPSNPEVFTRPGSRGGLSFYRLYNAVPNDPVPDSGATLALLGAGLAGLAAVSRRKA